LTSDNQKLLGRWKSKEGEFQRIKLKEESLEVLEQIDINKVMQTVA